MPGKYFLQFEKAPWSVPIKTCLSSSLSTAITGPPRNSIINFWDAGQKYNYYLKLHSNLSITKEKSGKKQVVQETET